MRYRRARRFGLALVAALVLPACSTEGSQPISVTTPFGQVTPSAAPSSAQPSAPSTDKPPRNDMKKGRVTRSLKAGTVKVRVKYSLRNRVQQWSPGVGQPLTVSLTARSPSGAGGQMATGQKIYLSRVTAYLEISDATGHLDSPSPLVDRADVTPGFLVTSPSYYDQVLTLPALPARATKLTIDFRYEILLLKPSASARDFEKRTATDKLVISRP